VLELDAEAVTGLVGTDEAIAAIADAYRAVPGGGAVDVGRTLVRVPTGWMRILPGAWPERGVFGYKEFHLVGGAVRHTTVLWDAESGEAVCTLDAGPLTALRTGATAAVAADALVPPGPARVAVIGSGKEARAALAAFACVRPLERVAVFSPRAERRERFAREMAPTVGADVVAVGDVRAATGGAGVVLVATASGAVPALPADAVDPGAHVCSIGSTLPEHRELETGVYAAAERVVVDTRLLLAESGDALAAVASADLGPDRVDDLAALLADPMPAPMGSTVFTSLGAGLQDIAVAAIAYRRARARGLGVERSGVAAPRVI
jgi:ornithine cyclodeaminase/alanine dehydrogenase